MTTEEFKALLQGHIYCPPARKCSMCVDKKAIETLLAKVEAAKERERVVTKSREHWLNTSKRLETKVGSQESTILAQEQAIEALEEDLGWYKSENSTRPSRLQTEVKSLSTLRDALQEAVDAVPTKGNISWHMRFGHLIAKSKNES